MNLKKLLQQFKENRISEAETLKALRNLPYEDLDFAKVDHHRALRNGFPEVVFCQGKTIPQIKKIYQSLRKHNETILLTRAKKEVFAQLRKVDKKLTYNEHARTISLDVAKRQKKTGILVIAAGTADIAVAEEAKETASIMGNAVSTLYDVGVAGLHRLLAHKSVLDKAKIIIVTAGMEGALPSVIGGLSPKPIIAVPTSVGYGSSFQGLAPLLTMLNSCAPGISVVNIDNGFGAGYLASLINRK